MQPSTLAKRGSILLFIAIIGFYFYGLGHLPLVGPDEPRYAQVAREMLLRRDLITPTLGGYPWFEKPALFYWMMIASFKLFGVSEWSARLPSAVSGVLTVAAVFCVARRTEQTSERLPGLSFWSALAAATTLGVVVFSRAASFDIILTMTTSWALAFFILFELEERAKPRRGFLIGYYTFMGLSLLAKGLVGMVIPLGVAGAFYLFRRRFPERTVFFSLFWGMPLALLVAGTWYVPAIWKHGWAFIDQFFLQHQFARYVSNNYRHPGPFYYHLLVLVPLTLPWTAFLVEGIAKARGWRRRLGDHPSDSANRLLAFAFVWLLLPLLFFSLSRAKLPGYILPVIPAAALIAGERLSRLTFEFQSSKWALRMTAAVCLLFAAAAPIYAWRSGAASLLCGLMITVSLIIAGCFALFSKRQVTSIMLIAGATVAVVMIVLHCGAAKPADRESAKRLLEMADARGHSQTPIYGLQPDDRTPEFYAAGRVVYGSKGEPIMYDGLAQVGNRIFNRKGPILVFVPPQDVSLFAALKDVQTEVIGNNGRFALIAVQAR